MSEVDVTLAWIIFLVAELGFFAFLWNHDSVRHLKRDLERQREAIDREMELRAERHEENIRRLERDLARSRAA